MAVTDIHRRRRGRNFALAGVLVGLAVLFFVITMIKLGAN